MQHTVPRPRRAPFAVISALLLALTSALVLAAVVSR